MARAVRGEAWIVAACRQAGSNGIAGTGPDPDIQLTADRRGAAMFSIATVQWMLRHDRSAR